MLKKFRKGLLLGPTALSFDLFSGLPQPSLGDDISSSTVTASPGAAVAASTSSRRDGGFGRQTGPKGGDNATVCYAVAVTNRTLERFLEACGTTTKKLVVL